ncbi:MAG: 2-phospho-L-lactate transferase [Deltaproteobacteria bacterium]
MITALGGGVGAAKFLSGLHPVLSGESLLAIVNTADDITISGLRISPDIDTTVYWLSGMVDRERGWGIKDDTFNFMDSLERFGVNVWFKIGDGDLATHVHRTRLREKGATLSEITRSMAKSFGVGDGITILPMTDEDVETWILTDRGSIHFQEYLIKNKMTPEVRGVSIRGIEKAKPAPGVIEAIHAARGIIICPSNPIISIGTILQVPGIREALRETEAMVLAVSPLVGGVPIKGPADRLMRGLGLEVSSTQIAKLYSDFLDIMVIDGRDADEAERIKSLGLEVAIADTLMLDQGRAEAAAAAALRAFDSA